MKPIETELKVPNRIELIYLVRKFIEEMASLCGFPKEKITRLIFAGDEAFTNIITHAFEKEEDGKIFVRINIDSLRMTLSFIDEGVPFSASLVPEYAPVDEFKEEIDTKGLGLFLIKMNVDDLLWMNYGRHGKELRLIVNRSVEDESSVFCEEPVQGYSDEVELAREQEYLIRRLKETEAIRISQCIYKAYGYTYPNEDLYYPERIIHLNRSGELISAVAVDESGNIVGHYALERPGLGKVAESGQAVVEPAHRGRELMTKMRNFLEAEALQCGIYGIYSQPITNHIFSQMVNENFNSKVSGITLALVPESLHIKKLKTSDTKRVTSMLYYKTIARRPEIRIYVPEHHQAMIERIYQNIGLDYCIGTGPAECCESKLEVRSHSGWDFGIIKVLRCNSTTGIEISRAFHDLCNFTCAKAIYLELPLVDPLLPEICGKAEECGFFFSGIGPDFFGHSDVLRLQYLNCELNFSEIQIVNPFGLELFEYIKSEKKRVEK